MKKRIALLLAAVLTVGTLATACGGNGNQGGSDAAANVKIGLAAHTDFAYGSHSIGDVVYGNPVSETTAQADIHVAAVMLDADGKIVQCVIDAVQVKANVDATGAMTTDPATTFQTKKELGTAYNMAGASPIGKEWDAQAAAFEAWCVGKTPAEVTAAVSADGYPTDETLLTGCTIKVNAIQTAVVRACEAAIDSNATAADTLGLGMTAELSSYAAATAEADGKVQAYVNYAATAKNAEGKITAVLIDSVQANSTWGVDGILTTDMANEPVSKYNKQYDYGMAPVSTLEKGEWFEQIDAFKATILGMDAAAVDAIATDDGGYPTDETLRTGCTMKVKAYKTAVCNALSK